MSKPADLRFVAVDDLPDETRRAVVDVLRILARAGRRQAQQELSEPGMDGGGKA